LSTESTKTSELCFKIAATAFVIGVALAIPSCGMSSAGLKTEELWFLVLVCGVVIFATVVIGIIASIWEK